MGQGYVAKEGRPIILIRVGKQGGSDGNDYEIVVKASGKEETKFVAGTFTPQTMKKLQEAE